MGWDEAYRDPEPAPWDIGRPQPEIVRLEESTSIVGSVIDVGCGTGENALYLASRGHETLGIDVSETAIARGRAKASERGLAVEFVAGDVLELSSLQLRFDTAIDVGCFHTFSDDDRDRYRDSVRSAVRPGGILHLLCFSDREPGEWGPRRVSRTAIETSFATGWDVESIEETRFAHRLGPDGALAWRARIRRT
jgi:cyclopropane fatty-acyl-phospholipid synthase-like methyltransferase